VGGKTVIAEQIDRVRELVQRESGLAVVTTLRADGTMQASIVNAGVVSHPLTRDPVVGFAVRGRRHKLDNLRKRSTITVVFRAGWDWISVEGDAEIIGPDDTIADLNAEDVLQLLREIYAAAVGGTASDWQRMDRTMVDEGHSAVLIRPKRVYSNPPDHSA
jgi:PPOX class probable F420-dependent enzyme